MSVAGTPVDLHHPRGIGTRAGSRHRNVIRVGVSLVVVAGDVALILVAAVIGAALRQGNLGSLNWLQAAGVLVPAYALVAVSTGAYEFRRLQRFGEASSSTCLALAAAAAFGFCAAFAFQVGSQFSRLETLYTLLAALALLLTFRLLLARLMAGRLGALVQATPVILWDGAAGTAQETGGHVIDVRDLALIPSLRDPEFLACMGNLLRDTDRVVIAMEESPARRDWVEAMRLCGLDAELVAELGGIRPIALSSWDGRATLVISRGALNIGERTAKRAFDILVTCALLPIVAPTMAMLVVLVKFETPGPAFFVQQRVGRNNRPYSCWKLRTMRAERADAHGDRSVTRDDERVTRMGRLLRRTSLDELPQFWNVLRGDMSLVGPRPHALGSRADGILFWELVPDYWVRHSMKPGLTGLAQVRGLRGTAHRRSDIEGRVAADLEYINRWSLWLDVKILVRTAMVLIHRNAY